MHVKLVYVVDDLEIVLAEDSLDKMDFFTFNNFDSEEDIISSDLYKEKLRKVPEGGKVVLQYFPFEIPVKSIDFYVSLGGNPFLTKHQLDVWYKEENVSPSEIGIISSVRERLDTLEKVDVLRSVCSDFFKARDIMIYSYGALFGDRDVCLEILEGVLDKECNNSESHFFRRFVYDRAKKIGSEIELSKTKKN